MGLSATELQSLRLSRSGRAMRASTPSASARMEKIMQGCMVKVAGYHMDFLGAVLKAIDGTSLAALRESAKAVEIHPRGCGCCSAIEPPTITKADVSISVAVDLAIDASANQLFSDIWGTGVDIHAKTILPKTLYELVKESIADGFDNAGKEWEKRAKKDREWAASNPFPDIPLELTPDMRWLDEIYTGGFKQVKDHIFQNLTPSLKRSIIEQRAAGLTSREISENLYSAFGPGGQSGPFSRGTGHLWQWQRLVRTEGHNAVFRANNEEFKDTGAKYVKWSRATNSEKCKCITIAAFNNGYYSIDNVPDPPHPNCRCSTNPVFNLPFGVTVDDAPEPKPTPTPAPEPEPEIVGPVGAPNTGKGKARITGKHELGQREIDRLEAHATAKLKEYGINGDIEVEFFEGKTNGGHVKLPIGDGSTPISKMYISSKYTYGDIKYQDIISHELKHVEQINSGKFYQKPNGDFMWDGKKQLSKAEFTRTINKMSGKTAKSKAESEAAYQKYKSWPWEAEAYATEGK